MEVLERSRAQETELTALLAALSALKRGDSSVRLPLKWSGLSGKVAEAFNDVVELNERMSEELTRLSKTVGKEGKLRNRAHVGDVRGFWKNSIDCVNSLASSAPSPRAICRRPCRSRSMTGASRENFCALRRPSIKWSISWARSLPK